MIQLFNRYFHPLSHHIKAREHYLANVRLADVFYPLVKQPELDFSTLASDYDYLVVDLETTGLDSEVDRILSIGWVTLSAESIDMTSAHHYYVNSRSQIKAETAIINHITPQMLEEGISIHDAMNTFFEAAHGKILVAHGCMVESNFINRYLSKSFGLNAFPLTWLDTLCIEKKMAKAINHHEEIDVSLSATRQRYQLPEYFAHNALTDAVATAELLLAQKKRIASHKTVTLSQLYKLSH
ncbi:3'-5' exonuclease [Vibrio scophthalmi]